MLTLAELDRVIGALPPKPKVPPLWAHLEPHIGRELDRLAFLSYTEKREITLDEIRTAVFWAERAKAQECA